jgi:hypothetical protein
MSPKRPLDNDHDNERKPAAQVDPSSTPLVVAISVLDMNHIATSKLGTIPPRPNNCTFSPADFDKIMRLLSDDPTPELRQILAAIFNRLEVVVWSDLMLESPKSVEDAHNGVRTGMVKMSANMLKKLEYIVRYARINDTLASDTTLRDIIQSVDAVPSTLVAVSATAAQLQTNKNGECFYCV